VRVLDEAEIDEAEATSIVGGGALVRAHDEQLDTRRRIAQAIAAALMQNDGESDRSQDRPAAYPGVERPAWASLRLNEPNFAKFVHGWLPGHELAQSTPCAHLSLKKHHPTP
jgi:hypothetical protein